PDRFAVLSVPLGPAHREVAELIAAGTDVPGFGDQLDAGERRILVEKVKERGTAIVIVALATQGGSEIEAKAVDVHLRNPVAKRVENQLGGLWVSGVDAVSGAGEVQVV